MTCHFREGGFCQPVRRGDGSSSPKASARIPPPSGSPARRTAALIAAWNPGYPSPELETLVRFVQNCANRFHKIRL